jgi:hypothetical protein
MWIDLTEEDANAQRSSRCKYESDSNEANESNLHSQKQFGQRISTVYGMRIDVREELVNAQRPIRFKSESDSKEIDESDLHS